jgi:hypothetical protein
MFTLRYLSCVFNRSINRLSSPVSASVCSPWVPVLVVLSLVLAFIILPIGQINDFMACLNSCLPLG